MNINPYLSFNDQCEEAFNFYIKTLGGKFDFVLRNGESPMRDNIPSERHQLIMHAQISLGAHILMGADFPADMHKPAGNVSLTINYDTPAEAEKAFAALATGANVRMPMQPTFFAKSFGTLTDRFGISWLIKGGDVPVNA